MLASIVAFDSSFLLPILSRNLPAPNDPTTGLPVEAYYQRLDLLLTDLKEKATTIMISAPVLAEFLTRAGKAEQQYLNFFHAQETPYLLVPFDTDAAVQLAAINKNALQRGDKRAGATDGWQKVKYDRQIVAVAEVNGAQSIYSDDRKLCRLAQRIGMETTSSWQLPTPPSP